MLFRACELTLNLDADQTLAVYNSFLSSFESIASSIQPSTETNSTSTDSDSTESDTDDSGDGEVAVE